MPDEHQTMKRQLACRDRSGCAHMGMGPLRRLLITLSVSF